MLYTGIRILNPSAPPPPNFVPAIETCPTCVSAGHSTASSCARVQRGTAFGSPKNPGGNSVSRSRTSPPASSPFARSLNPTANVASYGCEPACVSTVPSAFENHTSHPEKPKPGSAELTINESLTRETPTAPPPVIVTGFDTGPSRTPCPTVTTIPTRSISRNPRFTLGCPAPNGTSTDGLLVHVTITSSPPLSTQSQRPPAPSTAALPYGAIPPAFTTENPFGSLSVTVIAPSSAPILRCAPMFTTSIWIVPPPPGCRSVGYACTNASQPTPPSSAALATPTPHANQTHTTANAAATPRRPQVAAPHALIAARPHAHHARDHAPRRPSSSRSPCAHAASSPSS